MPINRKTGEFKPTERQRKLGAATVEFSSPYVLNDSRQSVKVDVWFYQGEGEHFSVREVKGVSPSVAKEISRRYAKQIQYARSEMKMSEQTEYFVSDFFSRESGRTGVLMSNLASDSGMAQVFKEGLKGHLSPEAQANFDALTLMVDKISKDAALADRFYISASETLNKIASKYERWKQNAKAITERSFTIGDVKDLEKQLEKLTEIASEFYLEATGYDYSMESPNDNRTVEDYLREYREKDLFTEGEKPSEKKRKLRQSKINW